MLALAAENKRQQLENEALMKEIHQLKKVCAKERLNNEQLRRELQENKIKNSLTVDKVMKEIKYYTGFEYDKFKLILNFLAPTNQLPFTSSESVKKIVRDLTVEQQFLLVLMKLRQNFDFKHLAQLFCTTPHQAGYLFKEWIDFMYFRFGEIPTWPDRDILIQQMPEEYKQDFPVTIAILDGTEIKCEKPSALKTQSQCYSDYKSSSTLKGLVAVDARGSFLFISMLFSGSISDKQICSASGLLKQLELLMQQKKVLPGDGIMVDKGFLIANEIKELGLKLWIPPFASADSQMSQADVLQTKKIAKHRIVVENAIGRAKNFKILKHTMKLNMFPSINQIWFCCCFLTNFMPCLRNK